LQAYLLLACTILRYAIGTGESMEELSILDYKAMRDNGEEHLLLDVRETDELAICSIEGHTHISMHELAERVAEIAEWKDKTVVCQCRSGMRSQSVQAFLLQQGFNNVYNLTGGILAWGEQVDSSITPY
jgi:rhodanese-related sulfurtransferase